MFNKCLVCNSIINSKIFKNRTFLCPLCKNLMIKDSFNHFMVRCKNCFYPLVDEIYECPRCNMDAEYLKIYSEYDYSASFTRRLFERYKFEYEIQLRFFWAFQYNRIIRHIIESNLIEIEKLIVIPVPCSKVNLKKRGWDHMLEICKVLKRKFHINYLNVLKTNTLAKEPALEQKKLNLKERIFNAEKKFRINENVLNKIPKNSVLVIIDDIFTTGSTIYACSKLLSSNGFNVSQIMAVTAFQEL